jgi:hypothetical protein
MSFLNNFASQVLTGDQVRDWQHASKIFVDNNFNLSPKYGFLFHVAFDLNPGATRIGKNEKLEMGMLAKTVSLPKYTMETKTLNAYNRPNIIQNGVKYDSVNLTFHDDSADVMRMFWYDYYSYYFRDTDHTLQQYKTPHKYNNTGAPKQWGYTQRQDSGSFDVAPYINAIRIYSLHQKEFTEYILINPTIKSWKFGEHSNTDVSNTMQVDMSVDFETVLYSFGKVSPSTVAGFAELHYDKGPSPLTALGGGTNSLIGPGGMVDAVSGAAGMLSSGNIGGGLLTAGRAIMKNKNTDLKKVAIEDLKTLGVNILSSSNPFSKVSFPGLGSAMASGGPNERLLNQSPGVNGSISATPGATQASAMGTGLEAALGNLKKGASGLADQFGKAASGFASSFNKVTSNNEPIDQGAANKAALGDFEG